MTLCSLPQHVINDFDEIFVEGWRLAQGTTILIFVAIRFRIRNHFLIKYSERCEKNCLNGLTAMLLLGVADYSEINAVNIDEEEESVTFQDASQHWSALLTVVNAI